MTISGKQLNKSATDLPDHGRVLLAERGGLLVVVPLPTIGRALPVRCSARLPWSVAWCAGRAVADGMGVWLLDVAPSTPTRDPDHALLAPGDEPAWAVRVDRVVGLATIVNMVIEDEFNCSLGQSTGGLTIFPAGWPAGWPSGWVTPCILADGRHAGLLAPTVITRELADVAA